MALIGGPAFRPSGAVLRIQVGALLFVALYRSGRRRWSRSVASAS